VVTCQVPSVLSKSSEIEIENCLIVLRTNQWSWKPSSPSSSTASLRSRLTHSTSPGDDPLKLKRKRGNEPWKGNEECYTDMEGGSMQCTEVRNERRATVVCEKHRRWKVMPLNFFKL
jgi:hypothetical protein